MSDDLSEREYEVMLDTRNTAYEWHSGMWSPLYSYASTGTIWSEEHKTDLLCEIDEDIASAEKRDDLTELDRSALDHLRRTVEAWPEESE